MELLIKRTDGTIDWVERGGKTLNEYMIVYRQFRRGRRSLKTDYTLATSIRDAQMASRNWIKADVPLGSVVFVRKVG